MHSNINSILVVGSGPVIIGQSSEYDYSLVQACVAYKEDGIRVILINSNPATLATDVQYADAVYVEPLNIDVVKRIIIKEKPECILPTMGGEKAFEISIELYNNGFLDDNNVKLLSVNAEICQKISERAGLKSFLAEINEPSVDSDLANSVDDAIAFVQRAGLPVVVKPAYEMGNKSFDTCYTLEQLETKAQELIKSSMLHQIIIEKCVAGWKEIEYEVIRDNAGNCICVSNMENIDPVGIHAGDSIIVTPAQTLTDSESLILRSAALNIISNMQISGNCGIQFALIPNGGEYAVISITPRITRSSALISKATGYSIAKVAAKITAGYKLFEITNEITGCTTASNEPAIDYCVVKFPKWSFEKFDNADRKLGLNMQATGETISFGTSFELAFVKAVRSINGGVALFGLPKLMLMTDDELMDTIIASNDERIFAVYEAIKREVPFKTLYDITNIETWFLAKFKNISDIEKKIHSNYNEETYFQAKKMGFLDETIQLISGRQKEFEIYPSYNMVDTCAAEYDAVHPYFYSAYGDENEAHMVSKYSARTQKKVLVIGSGPTAVGSSGELDFCLVKCIETLKECGYTVVLVNNNPESVSTDFSIADRLYIDPLSVEDIESVILTERPWAAVTQYSGINSNKYSSVLSKHNIIALGMENVLSDVIFDCEKIADMMAELHIPYTKDNPFNATGIELDVICDGTDCLIPGVSEHIEKSGIHAGDSISVCPPVSLSEKVNSLCVDYACKIAVELGIKGIINVQLVLNDNRVYVRNISLNSLHNIPFICKATGLPTVNLAVRCMLGEQLSQMGFGVGLYHDKGLFAVRVPVFSFDKLSGTDTQLGCEMKSTGEVLGLAEGFEDALLKGLIASGMRIKRSGGVLVTVRNSDKQEAVSVADRFSQLDFNLFSTAGTAKTLNANHVPSSSIRKIHENSPHVLDLINSNKVVYVISTSEKAENAFGDDIKIRRRALEKQIPTFTTLETASALAKCLAKKRSLEDIKLIDITKIKE
jgi:carbamoyl-phosphate synthase large subunit